MIDRDQSATVGVGARQCEIFHPVMVAARPFFSVGWRREAARIGCASFNGVPRFQQDIDGVASRDRHGIILVGGNWREGDCIAGRGRRSGRGAGRRGWRGGVIIVAAGRERAEHRQNGKAQQAVLQHGTAAGIGGNDRFEAVVASVDPGLRIAKWRARLVSEVRHEFTPVPDRTVGGMPRPWGGAWQRCVKSALHFRDMGMKSR